MELQLFLNSVELLKKNSGPLQKVRAQARQSKKLNVNCNEWMVELQAQGYSENEVLNLEV